MLEVKPAVELDENPAPNQGWFCCAAPWRPAAQEGCPTLESQAKLEGRQDGHQYLLGVRIDSLPRPVWEACCMFIATPPATRAFFKMLKGGCQTLPFSMVDFFCVVWPLTCHSFWVCYHGIRCDGQRAAQFLGADFSATSPRNASPLLKKGRCFSPFRGLKWRKQGTLVRA